MCFLGNIKTFVFEKVYKFVIIIIVNFFQDIRPAVTVQDNKINIGSFAGISLDIDTLVVRDLSGNVRSGEVLITTMDNLYGNQYQADIIQNPGQFKEIFVTLPEIFETVIYTGSTLLNDVVALDTNVNVPNCELPYPLSQAYSVPPTLKNPFGLENE